MRRPPGPPLRSERLRRYLIDAIHRLIGEQLDRDGQIGSLTQLEFDTSHPGIIIATSTSGEDHLTVRFYRESEEGRAASALHLMLEDPVTDPSYRRDLNFGLQRLWEEAREDVTMRTQLRELERSFREAVRLSANQDRQQALYLQFCEERDRLQEHFHDRRFRTHYVQGPRGRLETHVEVGPVSMYAPTRSMARHDLMQQIVTRAEENVRFAFRGPSGRWDDLRGPMSEGWPQRQQDDAERRACRAAARAEQEAAEARGLALLLENLTADQRTLYAAEKRFRVVGGDSGKIYEIKYGRQQNVYELDRDGKRLVGWCFLPGGGLVAGDVMLAQKIGLELEEKRVLKIARTFEDHRPRQDQERVYRMIGWDLGVERVPDSRLWGRETS